MPYQIEYDDELQFVSIIFSGLIDPPLLQSGREEARRRLTEFGYNRLLVDAKDFRLRQSFGEEFDFAAEHPLMLPPPIRIAVVTYPQTQRFFEFVEDVAQNRGANLRVFSASDAAIRWLCDESARSSR